MKQLALCENHLFGKVYARGKHAAMPTVVVYVLRDAHASRIRRAHPRRILQNRVGLTVTKKLGGAVVRNRIKRRLRAAFTQVVKTTPVVGGKLVVIVARTATKDAPFDVLVRDMRQAFSRVGLLGEVQA